MRTGIAVIVSGEDQIDTVFIQDRQEIRSHIDERMLLSSVEFTGRIYGVVSMITRTVRGFMVQYDRPVKLLALRFLHYTLHELAVLLSDSLIGSGSSCGSTRRFEIVYVKNDKQHRIVGEIVVSTVDIVTGPGLICCAVVRTVRLLEHIGLIQVRRIHSVRIVIVVT